MKNIINIVKKINISSKTPVICSILAGVIVGVCLLGTITPQTSDTDFFNTASASYAAKTINETEPKEDLAVEKINVVITAYSSTPDQTDDTPFITASGKYVADGIIANNMLPFGTKIRIPKLYGDKIFTVEDRMNKRKSDYHIDIWMSGRPLAVNFGVKTAEIEILKN